MFLLCINRNIDEWLRYYRRIFNFAKALLGHFTGGMGHVNVAASLIFSGMSGSAIADAGGLGQLEIKAMRDEGYDE